MALSIDFTLTEAGIAAAFNAQSTGIDVALTHVAFGTGHKAPDGLETGLVTEVKREPISGGSRVRPSQIRVAAVWASQDDVADILEVGVYAGSVLFAYASSSAGTVIAKKVVGVDFVFYYDWVLSGIPADTISVVIDPNAAVALAALQIHIQDPLAHEQYLHRAAFAQDGAPFVWAGVAGGTPDTIALTLDAESVLTSYRQGQKFAFIAQGGNTGPVSLSVNGLAPHSVRKDGTDALAEGDIFGSKVYEVTFDGLNFQIAGVTDFYNKLQTYSRSEVNSLLGNKVNTIDKAAQVDAETGTDNAMWMTPLRVFQAIAAKVVQATTAALGTVKLSTQALAEAGVDTLTAMTPQGVLWAINALTRLGSGSYAADTGSANVYTVPYAPALAALTDGMVLRFKAKTANTGASTFSPNGLTAKPIVAPAQNALIGGEIVANGRCTVMYSLTLDAWILQAASGGSLNSGRLLNVQVITASGTYTPTVGTGFAIVEAVGGGGGSAYVPATSAGQWVTTGGAQAGAYAKAKFTYAQVAGGIAVTIGSKGVGGNSAGTVASTNGGSTSFGALLVVSGGARSVAGAISASTTTMLSVPGTSPQTITGTTIIQRNGEPGTWGVSSAGGDQLGGSGGSSPLGAGGIGAGNAVANPGTGYGAGAGGAASPVSTASKSGTDGSGGVVIVWEYAQ